MIVPDLDLLIFAYNDTSELHQEASAWWAGLVNGTEPVGMPWQVSNGVIRQMANPSVVEMPWTPAQATRAVAQWFGNDHIVALDPGPRYLEILEQFPRSNGSNHQAGPRRHDSRAGDGKRRGGAYQQRTGFPEVSRASVAKPATVKSSPYAAVYGI